MANVIKLPNRVEDVREAQRLRAELEAGASWDWSAVQSYSPDAARVLLHGLTIDADAERCGIESVPDALASGLLAFFTGTDAAAPVDQQGGALGGAVRAEAPSIFEASSPPRGSKPSGPGKGTETVSHTNRPTTQSDDVTGPRAHLVRSLQADLIGPYNLDHAGSREVLELPPSRYYLTGFLAPEGDREAQSDGDTRNLEDEEELGAGSDVETDAEGTQEPENKRKRWTPASFGLSVFVPKGVNHVRAVVRFAEYKQVLHGDAANATKAWERVPHPPYEVYVPLEQRALRGEGILVPNTVGVRLAGQLERVEDIPGLPDGAQALSLFVVNGRSAEPGNKQKDAQYLFQVHLDLHCDGGFLPRPNLADQKRDEWDERVADLQFRMKSEHAVGHGVAVHAETDVAGDVKTVRTHWIPRYEVKRVVTHDDSSAEVRMEVLAKLDSAEAVRAALSPLSREYGEFLQRLRTQPLDAAHHRDSAIAARRDETRVEVVRRAELARKRIEAGIARVAEDETVRRAFCLANEAMAMASRKRRDGEPKWRLFQLAFVLLNIDGIAEPAHPDRECVELIFFPTGGGKTEAYLGTIAFTLMLRRLRGVGENHGGLGVAVLLRYTLRLLTLDQLGRAALLMCALEQLRQRAPERLGDVRLSIGLWVGRSATANRLKDAAKAVSDYKNGLGSSPFPLTACPWCKRDLGPTSFTLLPNPKSPESVRAACLNPDCDFCATNNPDGLPILFVDDQIYRELPSFVLATVDKFAMMPWRGETGMLFGRALARDGRLFYGPMDKHPAKVTRLPEGLRPPELIVQDELHLISGPLGTMVGLYENAIDFLSTYEDAEGRAIRPKVVAATATVRRAREQIRAIFRRDNSAVFPPPGVDESETFFAKVDHDSPGRLYVGVAAQGRAMRRVLSRTYTTLLGAANAKYDPKGHPQQTADGYMTLAGYFNSLRELGGMRRIVEDEVRARVFSIEARRPEDETGPHFWFRNRTIGIEPVELTSREKTENVAKSKSRLEEHFAGNKERVDVLLASNMISVGVDIDRLGLMVVAGQPKTTAEYIQASSRVGREAKWPGLVVTCFNVHKPRDRSHYEHFEAYHASFYRFVEATSVTPFSGPALDKGLAGTLVAMARLSDPALTPGRGVMDLPSRPQVGERSRLQLEAGAKKQPDTDAAVQERLASGVRARVEDLLDAWKAIVDTGDEEPGQRRYSTFDLDKSGGRPLLYQVLDQDRPPRGSKDEKFQAPTSMRDVESTTHLWMTGKRLGRFK